MKVSHRKSKSRKTIVGAILLAALLMIIAVADNRGGLSLDSAAPYFSLDAEHKQVKQPLIHTVNDSLLTLDDWSKELLDLKHTGVMWTIRWDISLTKQSMEKMAQQLYVDEYNTALNKVISQGGTHIVGDIPQHNGKLVLQSIQNEAGQSKVIALLQLEPISSKTKELKKFVTFVDDIMSSYGDDITFSAKITGTMKEDALKRIKSVTNSTLVEEYKDESMKVVTAYSPKLKSSYWLTDNKMINLQYAVYVDKNTKESILTLAIPLISGEFGEITTN